MITSAPNRKYQICRRCVMDTSDPWIVFDEKGFCNHCRDFIEKRFSTISHSHKDNSALKKMLSDIRLNRKTNQRFDVLIGISGGTDSSYTLLLAKEAGLKVLAVHMDNGWDTPVAIQNINKLVSLDGVDYECEVLNWNNFKQIQRIFLESGLPDIELPTDIAILAVLNRFSSKYGIKTILTGGNMSSEGILPASWMYNPRDTLFAESVIKKSGFPINIFKPIRYGFRDEVVHRIFHRVKTFYPLNEFNYNKESAKLELKKKLGWQSPVGKHCESTYTRFCQLIYQPKRNKIDYRRPHLSTDICLGRTQRESALNELKLPAWHNIDVSGDLRFVSYKLGYEVSELEKIMQKPSLWYTDFPNRKKFLGLAYDLYRLVLRKQKATNF